MCKYCGLSSKGIQCPNHSKQFSPIERLNSFADESTTRKSSNQRAKRTKRLSPSRRQYLNRSSKSKQKKPTLRV